MTPIECIDLEEMEARCSLKNFEVLKVNFKIDVQELLAIYEEVKEQYTFQAKDGDSLYRGISLHYSDDENPFFDGLDSGRHSNDAVRLFYKNNAIAEKFSCYFSKLPFQIYRGRLLEAHPGLRIPKHSDGPIRTTFHLPLTSHADCLLYLNNKPFYLESDGSCYIVNTRYLHWAENKSPIVRVHLIGNISPMSFWPVSQNYLENLDRYYKRIGNRGFERMISAIMQKSAIQKQCVICSSQAELIPVIYDFNSEEAFELLCKPCAKKKMNTHEVDDCLNLNDSVY